MDTRSEWVRETLAPAVVARNWPGATLAGLELGGKLGGNATDGGFASSTYRLTLRVRQQDESTENTHHLLVKVSPEEFEMRMMHNSDLQFANEAWMYDEVVPVLEGLDPGARVLWPRCLLSSRLSEELAAVVMQDLGKDGGFRLALPAAALDHTHAALALERLGRLHALSYVLRDQKPEEYQRIVQGFKDTRFLPGIAEEQNKLMRPTVERGLAPLRLRPECSALVAAVERTLANPFAHVAAMAQARDPRTVVLCHGDFCRNNVLYQYDDADKPHDLRFIDFATMRESSPAYDIALFLYMSVSDEARRGAGLTSLLGLYHDSLNSTLRQLGGVADPWGGEVGALEREVGRHALSAYCICSFFLPVMMADGNDFQIEDLIKMTDQEKEEQNLKLGGPEATKRLVDMLLEFQQRGFVGLWGDSC